MTRQENLIQTLWREEKKKQFSIFAGLLFHIVFWNLQVMNTFFLFF